MRGGKITGHLNLIRKSVNGPPVIPSPDERGENIPVIIVVPHVMRFLSVSQDAFKDKCSRTLLPFLGLHWYGLSVECNRIYKTAASLLPPFISLLCHPQSVVC